MHDRLYRSRTDRMLFGVAGGMADWLDLDPSVVRLVWAILVLAGGIGLVLYIVAALVIPEEPDAAIAAGDPGPVTSSTQQTASDPAVAQGDWRAQRAAWRAQRAAAREQRRAERRASGSRDAWSGGVVVGVVLVIVGAWFLVQRFFPFIDAGLLWPVLLIVIGAAFLVGALGRRTS